MDKNEILSGLSDVQAQAASHIEGPSLIIAGAGSGKTRVLTHRIAYMLAVGIKPYNIMALTFTNKAAGEMKERIAKTAGADNVRGLWMGTFHSLFSRILRTEAETLGFTQAFTIYDTSDSRNLVKTIVKELNLNEDIYKPKDVASRISSLKNDLITPQAYLSNAVYSAPDTETQRTRMGDIYREYMMRCKRNNAMDFDDLLLYTNLLFRDHKDVLRKYQDKFRYILVDEYQDTNFSQYLIIKELSAGSRNICVVGDDAQSIYSFRGAKIENILRFTKDYEGAAIFKLEQNYRSTRTIVGAANSVISRNDRQIRKESFSRNEEGDPIKLISADTDKQEAFSVVEDIRSQAAIHKLQPRDIAVLYRTNSQSRVLEDAMRSAGIPYKIYGGLSFYQRAEIKDILAYVRLIVNPDDDEAIRRIINVPARGIGPTTMERIAACAAEKKASIWQTLLMSRPDELGIKAGTLNKVVEFVKLIRDLQQTAAHSTAYEVVLQTATASGIIGSYKLKGTAEAQSSLDNIEELINSLKQSTDEASAAGEQPKSVTEWMQEITLLTDADNEKPEDNNRVTMMTIHSAKGLEFKYIYVVGVEEGLFPSPQTAESPQSLEEERRLFYVAVTRAISRLCLSFCYNRYRWGTSVKSIPSRFLKEIDQQYLDDPSLLNGNGEFSETSENTGRDTVRTGGILGGAGRYEKREFRQRDNNAPHNRPAPAPREAVRIKSASGTFGSRFKRVTDTSAAPQADTGRIDIGTTVLHDTFGKGIVCEIDRKAPNIKAVIDFGVMGKRTLMLKFAKLTVLE